ncbi:pyridoxamine 5'-phosphate oxidase family protein [Metabacillus sp. KIGAM252]|uniref:Pyridoxamine 5'-phosphate oxidase family protein n=1 Tax=Metabacillus flavus TaxID=2823519 RepID=A0ABS5LBB7_9BACI|nr:pyridoxamine 5'-phosphate oxidase family protein [Metabacillus flavus]MBS2968022.1 pyridoxamine 5'-phosphate oxidase family protein [Metabacillus flavus]
MDQQELREQIVKLIDQNKIGTLATVKNGKPHSRYMTFFNENLTLYTPTDIETHKVEEVDENPNVHILLGYDGEGFGDTYVEIEGKASIEKSEELKQRLWDDNMKMWFDGPHDDNYIILKITPDHIRLMNKKGEPPHTLEV